ncbi:MAG: zinc metallopeptidase [Planctomycetia bacterium]|nr:zinc metallopeptidase [Planctomycetia bacterium]
MMFFDPMYMLFLAPAVLLAMWAQFRIKSTYATASQVPARMSGSAAAREILDAGGLQDVTIEMIPGQLSDHYDPRAKVLRLSPEVYQGRSAASVGIAAHEAGHALQDAHGYALMTVRNLAVPLANFGSGIGMMMLMAGFMLHLTTIAWLGLALFGGTAFFQIVNLPVEFNASSRAKYQLEALGIAGPEEMPYVRKVLNAAALTYVAATLQAVMQVLYFAMRLMGQSSRDER